MIPDEAAQTMDALFATEIVLSMGSIACLAWKIAGISEPAPQTSPGAEAAAGPQAETARPPDAAPAVPPRPDLTRARWALASPQMPVRLAAAAELAMTPGAEALELCLSLVRDPDYEIRRMAVVRVGAERNPEHTELLLQAARDTRIEVQNAACEGLVGNRDPRVQELFRRLALQGLHYARILGLRGLGACGGQEELLLEILQTSTGKVRDEAVVALAASKVPAAVAAVRDHLKKRLDEGPAVKPAEVVDEAQFKQVLEQEPSMPLIEELENVVRELPAGRRKGEVLGRLAAIAQDESVEERRRYLAIRGLGFLGGQPVLRKLLEYRQAPVTAVRFAATIAMGKLRTARAIEGLQAALSDTSPLVRAAAVTFLSHLGNAVERSTFEAAAQDPDLLVQKLASEILTSRPKETPLRVLERPASPSKARPATKTARATKDASAPVDAAKSLPPYPTLIVSRQPQTGAGDRALEKLLSPLRAHPAARPPRVRLTLHEGRKLTLSEVLRGA